MSKSKTICCKKYYTFLVIPLALCFNPASGHAGCSRGDIDHYLEKGFSPSQITSICGVSDVPAVQQAPVVASTPQPPTQSSTHYVPPVQAPVSNRNFLVDVINGYDVVLTTETLSYTMKRCYEVGDEDLFGFPPEICPEIRYTLNLNGMKIIDTGRKYFLFGPPEIVLKGQVRRDILTDLSEVDPKQKELLHKKIDIGDEVVLPIQQGTPMQRVETELKNILR